MNIVSMGTSNQQLPASSMLSDTQNKNIIVKYFNKKSPISSRSLHSDRFFLSSTINSWCEGYTSHYDEEANPWCPISVSSPFSRHTWPNKMIKNGNFGTCATGHQIILGGKRHGSALSCQNEILNFFETKTTDTIWFFVKFSLDSSRRLLLPPHFIFLESICCQIPWHCHFAYFLMRYLSF